MPCSTDRLASETIRLSQSSVLVHTGAMQPLAGATSSTILEVAGIGGATMAHAAQLFVEQSGVRNGQLETALTQAHVGGGRAQILYGPADGARARSARGEQTWLDVLVGPGASERLADAATAAVGLYVALDRLETGVLTWTPHDVSPRRRRPGEMQKLSLEAGATALTRSLKLLNQARTRRAAPDLSL